MPILDVTKDNFEDNVLAKEGAILVDFNADWCGPCQALKPIIEELSADFPIASVNIDADPELAEKYQVSSIPCLVLFKDGTEISRKIGLHSKKSLQRFLEEA